MKLEERRAQFRKGLHSLYLPYYDGLCNLLGNEWQPYYGLRTFEEQEAIFQKGGLTRARGGESPHNYGCASDWTLWDSKGNPIWLKNKDPLWAEYDTACWKMGLKWGGDFGDNYHNEFPIKISWRKVKAEYDLGGMDAAMKLIEKMKK